MYIIEDKKNKLVFELDGYTHTVCNLLRAELVSDDHVKAAAYAIEHPLIQKPRIIVETDGADPRKAVSAAIKRAQKTLEKISSEAKNIK